MANENMMNSTPGGIDPVQKRNRSYSFGWSPGLGGFPKIPASPVAAAAEMNAQPMAIPHARSSSFSSASDTSVEDLSFKDSSFSGLMRRGSMGVSRSPMFRRRPSLDEERILKGEFSF